MSIKSPKPTREALLKELESIRVSLLPEDDNKNNKPVIEQTMPLDENSNGILPGQQSLFETSHSEADSDVIEAPPIKKENPFLPDHIREKLDRERSLYQQEMDAAKQPPAETLSAGPQKSEHEALIDELVAEYLPKIEAEMRRRLGDNLKPS